MANQSVIFFFFFFFFFKLEQLGAVIKVANTIANLGVSFDL